MRDLDAAVPNWAPPPRPEGLKLRGHYVDLEPISAKRDAAPILEAAAGQGELWRFLFDGPYDELEPFEHWMVGAEGNSEDWFAAIRPNGGDATGFCAFIRINPEAGSIEIGNILFTPALQRTRAATEAMALMIGWAFEAGYRRVEWKCNALNMPSRRAAQRLGFSYEGIFRKAIIVKGRNRDTAWFAIIDEEWPDLCHAYQTWLAPENFDDAGQQRVSLSSLTRPILAAEDPAL